MSLRIVGAVAAALVAVLAMAVMRGMGAVAGDPFAVERQTLSFAFVQGPGWLGSAVAAGTLLAAGLIGHRAAHRAVNAVLSTAVIAVIVIVGAYAAWVLVWTTVRLAATGILASAPAQPFRAALLTVSGLILPAIILFLPAALLWAVVVRFAAKRFAKG